ncbi:MAG: hypothetical protein HOQ18_06915 [Dermatophilaceae bacterium]|nr:hypothetical protein [Dermatophilaceae bacterium]NUR79914.1 hypothetical protein [Dermatophilaceae bacterium]
MAETPPSAATARAFEPVRSVRLYERIVEQVEEAIAGASGNTLIQVCNGVVRDTVLSLISDKIAHARNAQDLMKRSLGHHASYVPKAERAALEALLDD